MKYWIPFRADSGDIWVEGPYDTRKEASIEQNKAKLQIQYPSQVGTPLVAESQEEARNRAHLFL